MTVLTVPSSQAQNLRRIIQLSGVVLGLDDKDNPTQLPGVHIYLPKAGRGTNTNPLGFFFKPVQVGDSIVISSVGYVRQDYFVPNHPSEYLTFIIELVQGVTYLREIEVLAFPTEEVFKRGHPGPENSHPRHQNRSALTEPGTAGPDDEDHAHGRTNESSILS
ncbi:MAG: carboxypeptidase-like regulatory domain-containing protein [Cyclobacteriaceae bacterium]|nr:carboxypeptidase-like regulatory domain-containing protein [Cyclobacteriaceae bacterium]